MTYLMLTRAVPQPSSPGLLSLRSSLLNWRVENGRTYHAMSDGSEWSSRILHFVMDDD